MECVNHPGLTAAARCKGCAEPFCENCLIEIHGEFYCGGCKMMTVKAPPVLESARFRCKDASSALTFSILGVLGAFLPILGIIFASIGLSKAKKAKQQMRVDTRLSGDGMVLGATVIGILMLVYSAATWLLATMLHL